MEFPGSKRPQNDTPIVKSFLRKQRKKERNTKKGAKKRAKKGCQKTDIKKAVKPEIAQAFTSNDRDSTDGIYLHNLRLVFFKMLYCFTSTAKTVRVSHLQAELAMMTSLWGTWQTARSKLAASTM